jgi:hypothetical protein
MNFLNSPSGPLGSAGQASTSTLPQNLFNNSGGFGSRFGAGLDAFKNNMGVFSDQMRQQNPLQAVKGLFSSGGALGNLFGGDGSFLQGLKSMGSNLSQIPQNLSQIPQNLSQIPQNVAQIPQVFASTFGPKQGNAGAPSSGVLSRFMNNG